MKLKFLFLALALILVMQAFSQESNEQKPVRKTPVSVWLNGGAGLNFADAYDKGAAPMSIWGLGVGTQVGLTVDWRRYHIQQETRVLCGFLLLPLSGYDIDLQENLEFLYRCYDSKNDRFHVWAGGSLQEDAFIRIIPSLGNASMSTAVFFNVNAEGMVQYDFAPIKNRTHNLLTVYGKLTLPLGGCIHRPPYAVIDNYNSDLELANTLLSGYETKGMLFPGVSTDIGLRFNLPNGNKIGFSYRWDYLTTRKRGYYRFDNAFHTLSVDFMFKLN